MLFKRLLYVMFLCLSSLQILTASEQGYSLKTVSGEQSLASSSSSSSSSSTHVLAAERREDFNPETACNSKYVLTVENVDINVYLYQSYQSKETSKAGSKNVIVLGLGKGAKWDEYKPYLQALPAQGYDVIVFDYRWHRAPYWHWMRPFATSFNQNWKEVQAVVDFVRGQPDKDGNTLEQDYNQVIGLGGCYSAMMFAMAQAQCKQDGILFDKLILDSCPLSVKASAESILKDPGLCWNPLEGGCPAWLKSVLGSWLVHMPLSGTVNFFLPDVSVQQALQEITAVPILFIRGKKDPMVSQEHFEAMWDATATQNKAALLTPFHHSNSFSSSKGGQSVYLHVLNNFIEKDFSEFVLNFGGEK